MFAFGFHRGALAAVFSWIAFSNSPGYGQESPNRFEVASIRQTIPAARFDSSIDGLRARFVLPLITLVGRAYSLATNRVSGPAWLNETNFEIAAKLPEGTSESQVPEMLRHLLEERFHLRAHLVDQERDVYALVIGKNGTKLKEVAEDAPIENHLTPIGIQFVNRLEPIIVPHIALFLDRPVIDLTGLKGKYSGEVALGPGFEAMRLRNQSQTTEIAAAYFEALSAELDSVETMGLKLERRRMPIPVVVVDSIDRQPTEN